MKKIFTVLVLVCLTMTGNAFAQQKKNSLGANASIQTGDAVDFYFAQVNYSRIVNDRLEAEGFYSLMGDNGFTMHTIGAGGQYWLGAMGRPGTTVPFAKAAATIGFGDIDSDIGFQVGAGMAHFVSESLDARVTASYASTLNAIGDGMFIITAGLNYHF